MGLSPCAVLWRKKVLSQPPCVLSALQSGVYRPGADGPGLGLAPGKDAGPESRRGMPPEWKPSEAALDGASRTDVQAPRAAGQAGASRVRTSGLLCGLGTAWVGLMGLSAWGWGQVVKGALRSQVLRV